MTTHTLFYRPTWGKVLSHDCDRRDRLCITSDVSGSTNPECVCVLLSLKLSVDKSGRPYDLKKHDLLHEFLTMFRLTISTIRFDGAPHLLLITPSMLLSAILWLHTLMTKMRECHFCLLYSYCPDDNDLSVWEKPDHLQSHELSHNLVKDLHVLGSYVTGHLPHAHPHVTDRTPAVRPTMIV